jgi:uncharacterized protein (DUF2147 family)
MGTALMIISSTHSGKRLVSLGVWLLLLAISGTFHTLSAAAAADTSQSPGKIDAQQLLGQWLRPDGGYILELKEIGKDGTLKTAYFNPRPSLGEPVRKEVLTRAAEHWVPVKSQ